jgi:hypothetical protein
MTHSNFELHVLVGEPALFMPDSVDMDDLLRPLGPEFRSAPTGWMSRSRKYRGHNFLIEERDRRVVVMARSLAAEFGGACSRASCFRSSPPGPGAGPAICWQPCLRSCGVRGKAPSSSCMGSIWPARPIRSPSWRAVLAELTRNGLPARLPDDPVLVVEEGSLAGQIMIRNQFCCALTAEVAVQAADLGLGRSEPERLMTSCAATLAAWTQQGLEPSAPVGTAPFRQLASTLLHHLIAVPAGKSVRS